MKHIVTLLLALVLLPVSALAADFPEPVSSAIANLTEVFGYTAEEADAFTFDVIQDDTAWTVAYYDPDHPSWIYTLVVDKTTGRGVSGDTPFKGPDYVRYPGENAVRGGLRAARENGWFTDLSAENRAAFLQWMEQWGVDANDTLKAGLTSGGITGAQAVHAYFESCYGDPGNWPEALTEWRDEELASYGFSMNTAELAVNSVTLETPPVYPQGITRYEDKNGSETYAVSITEFAGETPPELAQALSHPMLAGWACICGAFRTLPAEAYAPDTQYVYSDTGLLAMEKDGARALFSLWRLAGNELWTVRPVGQDTLLTGRDLLIAYDSDYNVYSLNYPLSDTETETFCVRAIVYPDYRLLFQLEYYRHVNAATGESVLIAAADGSQNAADDGAWYRVTTSTADGAITEEQVTVLVPPYLDYIDADAFPKTAEACRADAGYPLPDKYGAACGVHLREKTSSRSADLGMYEIGTLVEVLGETAGDPYPWCHVRIGSMEGYMSGIYVDYPGSVCCMKPLQTRFPLSVAKVKKDVGLKKGVGWFDGTVTTLPAGTKMHVLAERGNWLHVMVPQNGEPGWLMDINGTDGYVKASDVLTAATSQQLDWLK